MLISLVGVALGCQFWSIYLCDNISYEGSYCLLIEKASYNLSASIMMSLFFDPESGEWYLDKLVASFSTFLLNYYLNTCTFYIFLALLSCPHYPVGFPVIYILILSQWVILSTGSPSYTSFLILYKLNFNFFQIWLCCKMPLIKAVFFKD